jgi:hypothetical protein
MREFLHLFHKIGRDLVPRSCGIGKFDPQPKHMYRLQRHGQMLS